jgi:hypothetical protein
VPGTISGDRVASAVLQPWGTGWFELKNSDHSPCPFPPTGPCDAGGRVFRCRTNPAPSQPGGKRGDAALGDRAGDPQAWHEPKVDRPKVPSAAVHSGCRQSRWVSVAWYRSSPMVMARLSESVTGRLRSLLVESKSSAFMLLPVSAYNSPPIRSACPW